MVTYALVGLGGALGSMCRFWLTIFVLRLTGPAFPWGTIMINVVGSFAIGWFGARLPISGDSRAFFMAGICGGFTTFSAFSLQNADLVRTGQMGRACLNIGLSVGLCLAATFLGLFLARQ